MIPRRVSGFNLPALLPEHGFNVAKRSSGRNARACWSLEAKAKLVDNPPVRSLLVFGFPDIFAAADHVVEPAKFHPIGLEALDDTFIDYMKKKGLHPPNMNIMPEGHAWLLVEFGGNDKEEADANAPQVHGRLQAARQRAADEAVRRSGGGEARLASARGGPRRDRESAGHAREPRGLGRRLGPAGEARAHTFATSRS